MPFSTVLCVSSIEQPRDFSWFHSLESIGISAFGSSTRHSCFSKIRWIETMMDYDISVKLFLAASVDHCSMSGYSVISYEITPTFFCFYLHVCKTVWRFRKEKKRYNNCVARTDSKSSRIVGSKEDSSKYFYKYVHDLHFLVLATTNTTSNENLSSSCQVMKRLTWKGFQQ